MEHRTRTSGGGVSAVLGTESETKREYSQFLDRLVEGGVRHYASNSREVDSGETIAGSSL